MKNISLFVLIATATLAMNACKTTAPTLKSGNKVSPPTQAYETKGKNNADSLIFSFERTACFGQCPIYKIHVYRNGIATYEGINFVDKIGNFTGKVSNDIMERIYNEAMAIHYFDLKDEYVSEITDFPSQITYLSYKGKSKKIVNPSSGPPELKDFYKVVDELFKDFEWLPIERD